MVVAQVARDVETIPQPAQTQCQLDTEPIRNTAREEANNTESSVDSNIRVISCRRVKLPSTAKSVDCVEHAGAKEADECHKDELDLGRGIAGDCDGADAAGSKFPSGWKLDLMVALVDG